MNELYRLQVVDSGDAVFAARSVDGLFLDGDQESDLVRFVGVDPRFDARRRTVEDIELLLVDERGEIMGSHYIGRVSVLRVDPSTAGLGLVDVTCSFFGYSIPHPGAESVWRRWAARKPERVGEWILLPPEQHGAWLYVVGTAWFSSERRLGCSDGRAEFVVNGSDLVNWSSFYCALGEAVNGSGGYFGWNTSALEDCIGQCRPLETPRFRLHWLDFDRSSERLVASANDGEEELNTILAIFDDQRVQLVRE